MSVLEWKSCEFYELIPLSDVCKIDIHSKIVAHCANGNLYVCCEDTGLIHVCFRNTWATSFQYQNKSDNLFCALTTNNEYLVLVSELEHRKKLRFSVLSVAKLMQKDGYPNIGSAVELDASGHITCVKACMMNKGSICISIGLDTGDMLLYRSVLNVDLTTTLTNTVCMQIGKSRVIGIEYQQKNKIIYMFVCCEEIIRLYIITNNSAIRSEIVFESSTTAISCCSFYNHGENAFLLVGREDAVYCFTTDGRGPCYAISGKKKQIRCLNERIVIMMESEEKRHSYIIVIDVYNKIIVYNREITNTNTHNTLVTNNSSCYLVIENLIYFTLERSIQSKLQILLNCNLYNYALRLLNGGTKDNFKGTVLLKYGDYYLQKGDAGLATTKYKETIPLIAPYFIIKRLTDSKYNSELAQYLGQLIDGGNNGRRATSKQKELFENCQKRIKLSLKCDNILNDNSPTSQYSKTLLKFLNKIDDILANGTADVCDNDAVINELIVNCPRITAEYWQKIFRALKELKNPRFIPLLIATKENCTEYLEYLASNNEKDVLVFSILLEQYLSEWHNGRKNVDDIIEFVKNFGTMPAELILISFVNHSFWPGIIYLHEHHKMSQMRLKYWLKCIDFPLENLDKSPISLNTNTAMQAFEIINSSTQVSSELMDKIISSMLNHRGGQTSILQVAHSISARKSFEVRNLKKIFDKNNLKKSLKTQNEIKSLLSTLGSLNEQLMKFRKCPIEFRENICLICKLNISLPIVYFLCQHAFHVECVERNSLSDNLCPLCSQQDRVLNENVNSSNGSAAARLPLAPNCIEHLSVMFGKSILS